MEFRSSRSATRCRMITDRYRAYSSSGIGALDGRSALRAPRLSAWGSEGWGAMFVSDGSRIPCVCMKNITGSSLTAAAPTASTSASCLSRCSSNSSLQTRYWARSPPYFVVADVECGAPGFAPSMSVLSETVGRSGPSGNSPFPSSCESTLDFIERFGRTDDQCRLMLRSFLQLGSHLSDGAAIPDASSCDPSAAQAVDVRKSAASELPVFPPRLRDPPGSRSQ